MMKTNLNELTDGVDVLNGRAVLKLVPEENPTAPWDMEEIPFYWVLVANSLTANKWALEECWLSHADVLRARKPRSFSDWAPIYEALNRLNDEHEVWSDLVGKSSKMWEMAAIEEKEESGYPDLNDARTAIFEEFVDDALGDAPIDTWGMLATLAKLETVREFRNGYSQGDDVEVLCIQPPGEQFDREWAQGFARRCCDYVVGDIYGLVVMDEDGTIMRGVYGLYRSELEQDGEWLDKLVRYVLAGAEEEMEDG